MMYQTQTIRKTTIEEELRAGKTVIYYTVGVSMEPLLKTRQTHVTIVPLNQAKKNDILLYLRENGDRVLHRLIRQDEQFYYMRGDNTYGLEKIEKSQAVGLVMQIYRNGRYIKVNENHLYHFYIMLWRLWYPFRFCLWKVCCLGGKIKRSLLR